MKLSRFTKVFLVMAFPILAQAESFPFNILCSSGDGVPGLKIQGGDVLPPDTADISFSGDPTGVSHAQFKITQKDAEMVTYVFTWAPRFNPTGTAITVLQFKKDGSIFGTSQLQGSPQVIRHTCEGQGPFSPLPVATFGN